MKEYVGIYIKTEKAQEQDGFGNKNEIPLPHNNPTYVLLLCVLPLLKLCILMQGCYVEVVFHFVAKAILLLCFFGFDIYPYVLIHF